jgi:hypothetical protein
MPALRFTIADPELHRTKGVRPRAFAGTNVVIAQVNRRHLSRLPLDRSSP